MTGRCGISSSPLARSFAARVRGRARSDRRRPLACWCRFPPGSGSRAFQRSRPGATCRGSCCSMPSKCTWRSKNTGSSPQTSLEQRPSPRPRRALPSSPRLGNSRRWPPGRSAAGCRRTRASRCSQMRRISWSSSRVMSWSSRNSGGPSVRTSLLGLEDPAQPVLARRPSCRGRGSVRSWKSCTLPFIRRKSRRLAVVGLVQLVAELEQRGHPDLLLVVLDHRLHRPVLVDDRADPAAEPAGAAARGRAIDDQRALAALGRPLVHAQERLVVVPPRVLHLHQEQPDVVVVPVLDRRVDQRVGQASVGASAARGRAVIRACSWWRPAAGSRPCACPAPGWPRRTTGPPRG